MHPGDSEPLEVSVAAAARDACPLRPLLDIRSAAERRAGMPVGALPIDSEALLERCRNDAAFAANGGFVLCAEGVRSLALVERLRSLGATRFVNVGGGFDAWRAAGLPCVLPEELSAGQVERYARHLVLPEVGPEGQASLLRSRVLLAGLGGLNSPAALYLAAAGVGTLGLLDDDRVARSNLQRQVLHADATVGLSKVESAARRLRELDPDLRIEPIEARVDAGNAAALVAGWDVVVDGTDNFEARYALNDACAAAGIPLVYGAVARFQGQVSVFWPARGGPCLRCLAPDAPGSDAAPSCSEAGVLGVLPGIVGALQAAEALKVLLGRGRLLSGRLLLLDALAAEFREMRIERRDGCPACAGAVTTGS